MNVCVFKDSEEEKGEVGKVTKTNGNDGVMLAGGLGSLVASYGDMTDSEDDEQTGNKPTVMTG